MLYTWVGTWFLYDFFFVNVIQNHEVRTEAGRWGDDPFLNIKKALILGCNASGLNDQPITLPLHNIIMYNN
jgi:hypothetical protein